MKPSLTYMGFALLPVAIALLHAIIIVRGFKINEYSWAVDYGLGILALFIIVAPLYLLIIAKHYTIKCRVSYALSIIVTAVSGFGSILILNLERWNKNRVGWDFASEIMFTIQLITVGSILLIGMMVVAYLKFKEKT